MVKQIRNPRSIPKKESEFVTDLLDPMHLAPYSAKLRVMSGRLPIRLVLASSFLWPFPIQSRRVFELEYRLLSRRRKMSRPHKCLGAF